MKFENIEIGDVVYVPERIDYSILSHKTFYIPKKVTKVTKTQFTTEDGRRFKKTGVMIGGGNTYCHRKGDKPYFYGNEIYDQTNEKKDFIKKVNLTYNIEKCIRDFHLQFNEDKSIEELEEIQELIIKLKSKL